VLVKSGIFCSEKRVDHVTGNLFQVHHEPPLVVKNADYRTVVRVEFRNGSRLILGQFRDLRQTVGIYEIRRQTGPGQKNGDLDNKKKGDQEKKRKYRLPQHTSYGSLHAVSIQWVKTHSHALTAPAYLFFQGF
jgi:hypothetical protein